MVNTLIKSTFREIRGSLGRYIAIMAIIAIGVAIFSGLKVSEPAMKETGKVYLDEHNFYDFRLISTLGFTPEDVESFMAMDEVECSEGSVFSEFLWQREDDESVLIAYTISENINTPDLIAGRMPSAPKECLADSGYFRSSDIGSVIRLSKNNDEDTLELFAFEEYTIVGLARSPLYINYERGNSSIGSGSISAFVLLPEEGFNSDVYYEIYLRMTQRAQAYSDDYMPLIDDARPVVEKQLKDRADERYNSLYTEASQKLGDAELELSDGWDEFNEAREETEKELTEALNSLNEGEDDYAEGLARYNDAANQYYSGKNDYEKGLAEIEEGKEQLSQAKEQLAQARADTDAQLADALLQLQDGEQAYSDGVKQWEEGMSALPEAEAQIEAGKAQLNDAKAQLDDAAEQLESASEQVSLLGTVVDAAAFNLKLSKASLDSLASRIAEIELRLNSAAPGSEDEQSLQAQLALMQAEYAAADAAYQYSYQQFQSLEEEYNDILMQYQNGSAQYNAGLKEYEEGLKQLEQAQSELENGRIELENGKIQLDESRAELDKGWADYYDGLSTAEAEFAAAEAEIAEAEQTIADGQQQLDEAKSQLDEAYPQLVSALVELNNGRIELDDAWAEYNDGVKTAEEEFAKAESELLDAETEIADARSQLDELKDADTFALTRNENLGYACFDSDTSIVAAISLVFPIFFFLVAALVCMTTMKRMVDEQRTQIGVLKALGYSNGQISGKYLFYSGSAAAVGCIIGFALGSTVLPLIMWEIYGIMYGFAPLEIVIDSGLAALTFAASMLCSMGATYFSCRSELRDQAAELIRPKTPKAGKRVFLERIGFIWSHLSFLQKVSVRNVLRYRSRFIMMVLGIGGCTALLVTGFGIKDSISNLANDQFSEITVYDYALSFSQELTGEEMNDYLEEKGLSEGSGLLVHSGSIEVISDSASRTVYLVSPYENDLEGFVSLHDGDRSIAFPESGQVVINKGLAEDLDVDVGDELSIRDTELGSFTALISDVCDNYIYNYIYISPDTFLSELGEAPEFNSVWIKSESDVDPNEESVYLADHELVSSITVNASMRDRLSNTLERLNLIVVVVVVCSAALAFVVLYNLTNINITERIREIATLKVLGFYPQETANYVFRELIMLATVGSLAGLLMGKALHAYIMAQINVEAMFFPCRILPVSYLLSFIFTVAFSILITFCMRPKLSKIDMAESLKSIE